MLPSLRLNTTTSWLCWRRTKILIHLLKLELMLMPQDQHVWQKDARLRKNSNYVANNNSYNMHDFAMLLLEYINDPIASDIVHNGATFQVAGLTNNSKLVESHEVRTCVQKYHSLGETLLKVAKRRLDNMLYVGLTEDHKGSATTFAQVVGAQVISQLAGLDPSTKHQTEHNSELNSQKSQDKVIDNSNEASPEVVGETKKGKMTVGGLMQAYEGCIANLRLSQSQRRVNSLKRISPVNFSKEARHQVPQSVIEQIISLNRRYGAL